MCGISGIVSPNKDISLEIIFNMNLIQSHRGPDFSDISKSDNVIFGHTRLSIVDITTGNQPMESNNNNSMITFNGEIYGYEKIKKTLDYKFKTKSDTEVILALYEKYKYKMFRHLSGMFAFAIWDKREKSLLLARDSFGEKPLYYAFSDSGQLIFASEIKAILNTGLIKPQISKKALVNYLANLHVKPNETIYKNIFIVEPGSYLLYKQNNISKKKHFVLPETHPIDEFEALSLFKEKLTKAVKNQLVADVEVGAFLSGGIDSSTIVSIAKKFNSNLKTFSYDFPGQKGESYYAKQIARKYKTEHINLDGEFNIVETFLNTIDTLDEPFADSSCIPTFLLSKFASKHVKVALTGDGADELLGGYNWWYDRLLDFGSNKKFYHEIFYRIVSRVFSSHEAAINASRIRLSRNYKSLLDAHIGQNKIFSDKEIERLTYYSFAKDLNTSFKQEKNLNDVLKYDIENYLSGDILTKTDRMSMANSLELRSPFLDREFASFCISLPSNLKINKSNNKILLRKAYSKAWTEDIRRRKKQGFGGSINRWLKTNEFVNLKNFLFKKDRLIFQYINYEIARKYFENDNQKTWSLLVLSAWFERNKFL